MKKSQFQALLQQINSLNYSQLKRLRHNTDAQISSNAVAQAISDREENLNICPHCHSDKLSR